MLDLSWSELLLVAVLALLVIGPKDLPAVFKAGGKLAAKGQRLYRSILRSMHQLEQEVTRSNNPAGVAEPSWEQLLPEEVRNLPADYLPGSMTAEQHAERQRMIADAQQKHATLQSTPAIVQPLAPCSETSANTPAIANQTTNEELKP